MSFASLIGEGRWRQCSCELWLGRERRFGPSNDVNTAIFARIRPEAAIGRCSEAAAGGGWVLERSAKKQNGASEAAETRLFSSHAR